jgi:hypothetical protein
MVICSVYCFMLKIEYECTSYEKSVQGFGGKARRKETTGKTKA